MLYAMLRSLYISIEEWFWSNVQKTETCWIWLGTLRSDGYGQFMFNGKMFYAHRFSYETIKGKIPDGRQLDHLCRNRACVNPDHLEAVTQKVNVLRGIGFAAVNARQTHCIRGHELTDDNVYPKNHLNRRVCKTCKRESNRKWQRDHKK